MFEIKKKLKLASIFCLKSLGFSIAILVVLVSPFIYFAIDQKVVERRAYAFCNEFMVGSRFDEQRFYAELNRTKNSRLIATFDEFILVQFRATLPHYYLCDIELRNGVIVGTSVEYKD